MQQMALGIGLLIGLWLLVLANLLGLIDVVLYRREDKATRWLGLVIGVPTVAGLFALALVLTPLMLTKITTSFDGNPNVELTRLA